MSTLVRPFLCRGTILSSPSILLRPHGLANARAFSMAARRQIEAGRPHRASTALKTEVHDREEGARVGVVGEDMKGAEGAHYQGQPSRGLIVSSFC
jgi:hypothetical protein